MLDSRKAKVLNTVVKNYIATGQPVGSSSVIKVGKLNVSSATVRADMAYLEQENYLSHTYTSSGRIPTDLGYRHYVNALASKTQSPKWLKVKLNQLFESAHFTLEEMLEEASGLLSEITHLASIAIGTYPKVSKIKALKLVKIHESIAILVLVISTGDIEKLEITLGRSYSDDELQQCSYSLEALVVNKALYELSRGVASPDKGFTELEKICIDKVVEFCKTYNEKLAATPLVFVEGSAYLANAFNAIDELTKVLEVLEEQYDVVSLIKELIGKDEYVSIGSEIGQENLSDCSIVLTKIGTAVVSPIGVVGVLGPKRMNYLEVIAMIREVSKSLNQKVSLMFSE